MNKRGQSDSHHIVLLAIVGVVALIGLVLAFGGFKGGSATGAVVLDNTAIVNGGPVGLLQQQVGQLFNDLGGIKEQLPLPDKISVFFGGVGDAFIYNKDGYVTDKGVIFGGPSSDVTYKEDLVNSFEVIVRKTSPTTVSLVAVSTNPGFHISFTDGALIGPQFSQLDLVPGTAGSHVFYVHITDSATGGEVVTKFRYASNTAGNLFGFWTDGIANGHLGLDSVTFGSSAIS